jgi:hypothetical protein
MGVRVRTVDHVELQRAYGRRELCTHATERSSNGRLRWRVGEERFGQCWVKNTAPRAQKRTEIESFWDVQSRSLRQIQNRPL